MTQRCLALCRPCPGIRQTVGFDFQPGTGALYFTNNAQNEFGNDVPDDTLNAAPSPGLDFGFVRCDSSGLTPGLAESAAVRANILPAPFAELALPALPAVHAAPAASWHLWHAPPAQSSPGQQRCIIWRGGKAVALPRLMPWPDGRGKSCYH